MSEEFITLVASMREAQRDYFDNRTRAGLAECKKLETRVDEWLAKHVRDVAQLDCWTRSVKSTELPGVYNVGDESEPEEAAAA
jgi:hypothetical protein